MLFINIQAQSVVFNNVYNNFNHLFAFDSVTVLYNNEIIYAFTNSNDGYFLSGNSSTNYSFTNDSARLSLFNIKINIWGDTIWQKIDELSINGIEGVGYFYEYPNKDLISAGTISDFFYTNYEYQDGLIYKTDSLGNELWRVRHNFGRNSKYNSQPYTKDDGATFQLLGFANIDTNGVNYDAFISTIDSSGNLLSNLQFGGSEDDVLLSLEYLDNGNYLVCGYTYSFGAVGSDIWLIEVDTNGTVIWQNNYGDIYYERIQNSRGMLVKNNFIYLAGTGVDTVNSVLTAVGWLIKLDLQGNIIWDKKYNRGSNTDYFVGIQEFDNNSFILGGQSYTYNSTHEYPAGWLLKVDTNGNKIWEREIVKYKDQTSLVHHYPSDMLVTQDKGILIGGYIIANNITDINGYFHRNDAWLAKTDSCGYTVGDVPKPMLLIDSIYKNTIYISDKSTNYCTAKLDWGDGTELQPYYAYENNEPLQEKHFSHTYTQTGDFTIKTTALAGEEFRDYEVQVLGLSVSGAVITAQAGISLFPNPASDFVIVQNVNSTVNPNSNVIPAQAGISMNIFNLNGKQVKTINLNAKLYQQKIDVSTLNNGVYFVRFMFGEELIRTEKLVIAR